MLRNKQGDESKQRELWQLEKKVADLINEGFITNFDNLISYLRKQYSKGTILPCSNYSKKIQILSTINNKSIWN